MSRAEWVKRVEQEEGASIVDVIRRERAFGVDFTTMADSFETSKAALMKLLRKIRASGCEI